MNQPTLWTKANSVIVYYTYKDNDEFERFRNSFDAIIKKNALMNSYFVVFVDDETTKARLPINSYFIYLHKKDFNFFNRIKNKADKNRLETNVDLLLVYGDIDRKYHRLVNKTKANTRVVSKTHEKIDYDIKLNASKDGIEQIANFTREILEKIQA